MMDRAIYRMMQVLPAEAAHDLGKWAMQRRLMAPGRIRVAGTKLFGVEIDNPLGLAAGFDKNGVLVDVIREYGFGFVEVGSVTFRGGEGNPKPRVFRVDEKIIMNRMGLPGEPAEAVARRLGNATSNAFGVNIAKTHSREITGDAAIEDIVASYKLLKGFGIYTVINISCPNTNDGRTFEECGALKELLAGIAAAGKERPLMVKISPAVVDVNALVDVAEGFGVDGYVCCNTLPVEHPKFGRGGMSGDAVREKAMRMISAIKERLPEKTVIGCGGVFSRDHFEEYLTRGCGAVEAYNGFVRGENAGVGFARRILK